MFYLDTDLIQYYYAHTHVYYEKYPTKFTITITITSVPN